MINLVSGLFHNEEQTKADLCDFIMGTDRLSLGDQCEKFEAAFAHYQGSRHCILFNSGSSANLALIQALLNLKRISAGQKAAFSAVTWATNVMPLIQLGLNPVPVDIEIDTLNVSRNLLHTVLDQHADIKLVFLTNLLGFCSDIDQIKTVCDERRIILIEDNCESLGTTYQGKKLGKFGLAGTFSFFVGHHMSTIEGGSICTDDPELDRMLRLVRAHGWDRNLTAPQKQAIRQAHDVNQDIPANFIFYDLAYNLRPTEITAFLGLQQMQFLPQMLNQRHQTFRQIQKNLHANPDIINQRFNHIGHLPAFAIPLVARTAKLLAKYITAFNTAKIEIRPLLGGSIPDQPFYRSRFGHTTGLANARFLSQHSFYFPNHAGLSATDLTTISNTIQPTKPAPVSSV